MQNTTSSETASKGHIILLCLLASFVILSWRIYNQFNESLLDLAKAYEWKSLMPKWSIYIGVIIPPIAGWLADKFQASGKNFVLVTITMMITAVLFLSTGFIANATSITDSSASPLPMMMLAWMIGMTFFFSPALNLIKTHAITANLTMASAWIVFTGDLMFALGKYINNIVQNIGIATCFIAAGVVLLVLGIYYHRFTKNTPGILENSGPLKINNQALLKIIALGFFAGLAKNMITSDYVLLISGHLRGIEAPVIIFFFAALLVLAFALKWNRWNKLKGFWFGFGMVLIAFITTKFMGISMAAYFQVILFIIGIALISFAVYPLAMENIDRRHANFHLGLLFSAFALSAFVPFSF